MSEKKLTKEQVEALQKCRTKEEVEKFAKENQLTDEELEKVVGGTSQCEPSDVTEDAILNLAHLDETPFS